MKWFKSDMYNKCIKMRVWSRIYMSLGIFHENIKQEHQNESVKQNPYVTYTLKTDMNIINDTTLKWKKQIAMKYVWWETECNKWMVMVKLRLHVWVTRSKLSKASVNRRIEWTGK